MFVAVIVGSAVVKKKRVKSKRNGDKQAVKYGS